MKESREPQQHMGAESATQETAGASHVPPKFALTAGAEGPPAANAAAPAQMMMATHQVVQRQVFGDSPTGTTNPNAIIPVADLIRYVEDVERGYPRASRDEILTRIRQLYYSGAAFDQLIHGAPTHTLHTSPVGEGMASTRNLVGASRVSASTHDHLTARADENAIGDNPSPYILLTNGERIDLGHMLLGMDALAHPTAGAPYTVYGVPNIDPSSWVADLGIAAVWTEQHEDTGTSPSDAPVHPSTASLDEYYRISAPTEDLLGDVDSFGAGQTARSNPSSSLSAVLREYYLGTSGGSPAINSRWQTFCSSNGFRYTNSGGTVTWDPSVRTTWETRINRFNDLYAGGSSGAIGSSIGSVLGRVPASATWRHTPAVLTKFLNWLKPYLEAELRAHP